MFFDESIINAKRRNLYVDRIREHIKRVGVIDGVDALSLGEDLVRSFEFALRHHLAEWNRVELRTQAGIGTQEWVRVRGRVAERSKVALPEPDEEVFDILISCWYQFLFHGQPVTPVVARRGATEMLSSTDEEGFFDVVLSSQPETGDFENFSIEIEVGDEANVRAEREVCDVIVPHVDSAACALVDIDNLILSHPTNRFAQVLGSVILGEQHRIRRVDPTLSMFFEKFAQGKEVANPFLYLSNTPRHLNQHLDAVRRYAGLPHGYVHLRDFSLKLRRSSVQSQVPDGDHAKDLIEQCPEFPLIFIGAAKCREDYVPMLRAIKSRLSVVYLFGEDTEQASTDELGKELNIPIIKGNGDTFLSHAIAQEWIVPE